MKNHFSGVVDRIDPKGIATITLMNKDLSLSDEGLKLSIARLPVNTLEGDYLKLLITQDTDMMHILEHDEPQGGYIKKAPVTKFRENT